MKVIEKNINGVNVTCVDIDKFKSICGILCFKTKFKKDMILTRIYIKRLLINSTKKYPTNKDLTINCLENFGAHYSVDTRCDGNYFTNIFMFRFLDDRYIDKKIINNSIDTFNEIVFNPNASNNKFDEKEFSLVYKKLKAKIEREKEDAMSYVKKKMDEQMGEKTPLSYYPTIDMFERINNEDVYNDYLDMINNSEVSLFIAGHNASKLNIDKILNNIKTKKVNVELKIKTKINKGMQNKKEKYDGLQSILSVGIKLSNLTKFESTYVVPVFNSILGAGASSRLFNEVREKNSLCYFCFSKYDKDSDIIRITSGIEYQNYDKTLKLIKKVINSMNKVTEDEVKTVINDISSALMESLDELSNYVVPYYVNNLYEEENTIDKIKEIKKVTKDDVEKIFSKLTITDSFFLEGGKTGE